jgi:hypothetical protein
LTNYPQETIPMDAAAAAAAVVTMMVMTKTTVMPARLAVTMVLQEFAAFCMPMWIHFIPKSKRLNGI